MGNPVVMKDKDHFAIWIYLLLNATHDVHISNFDGKKVKLKPGELIIGRRRIAAGLDISESKVQRVLKLFETEQQIRQRTCTTSRLISILKWKDYQVSEQASEQRVNNDRTTSEQPVNTIQECKNVKNEKKREGRENFFSDRGFIETIYLTWRISEEQLGKMLDDFDLLILAENKENIGTAEYRNYFHKWGAKRFSEYNKGVNQTGMVF